MASVTNYAVLPLVRVGDGNPCPDEAVSPTAAAVRGRTLAAAKAGPVAFSRTGNPETGD